MRMQWGSLRCIYTRPSADDITCPSHSVYIRVKSLPHITAHPRLSTTTRFNRFDINIFLIASVTRLHSY